MFQILADWATWRGLCCATRAERHQTLRDFYIERGKYWADVAAWLRSNRAKPLSEIREERKWREAE